MRYSNEGEEEYYTQLAEYERQMYKEEEYRQWELQYEQEYYEQLLQTYEIY